MTTTLLALTLPARSGSIRAARAAVEQAVRPLVATERMYDDIRLCLSEAATNVVRHAYEPGSDGQSFDVEVEVDADELTIAVRDLGRGISRRSDADEPGGYGLSIIESLASRLRIASASGHGTEISMVFLLARRPLRGHGGAGAAVAD